MNENPTIKSTSRPLVGEFRNLLMRRTSRVIIDLENWVVGFAYCHRRRLGKSWTIPFQSAEKYFECPLSDILAVSEFARRGQKTLKIVTSHGQVVIPDVTLISKCSNYDRLKDVFSQVAHSVPPAASTSQRVSRCIEVSRRLLASTFRVPSAAL